MTSEKTAPKSTGDLTMVTKTRSLALSGQPTAAVGHDEAAMAKAAREMLDRHDRAVVTDADIKASEADIRSCIRDLLLASGLARREDIQLESQRTDLRTGQAIFEIKRRIGLVGAEPSPENLEQLDGYLDEAARTGRPERLGILADGRHWALDWGSADYDIGQRPVPERDHLGGAQAPRRALHTGLARRDDRRDRRRRPAQSEGPRPGVRVGDVPAPGNQGLRRRCGCRANRARPRAGGASAPGHRRGCPPCGGPPGPSKAVLPFTRLSPTVPKPDPTTGDVPLHELDSRVRGRWKDTAEAWNAEEPATNRLSLIEQLDTMNKLSNQVPTAAIRLLYSKSGRPTAAVLEGSRALIDNTLYWIECVSADEAHYLAAIINSDTLRDAVEPLMPKGQFGARDLHKHLWKLNVPQYDPSERLHRLLAGRGAQAAAEAAVALTALRTQAAAANQIISCDTVRRQIRSGLAGSRTGASIERLVSKLNL